MYSALLYIPQQFIVTTAVCCTGSITTHWKILSAWRSWPKHIDRIILGGKTAGKWSWPLISIYCRSLQWLDV